MSDRPSRGRRLLSWTLRVGWILAILSMVAFLTRRQWIEPIAISQIEAQLEAALDADVTIRSIGGNWIDTFVIDGVEIRDSDSLEIENGRFELALDLSEVFTRNWFGAIHGLRASASRLAVAIPEAESSQSDETGFMPDIAWAALHGFSPAGVRLEVADCTIRSEHGSQSGRVSVSLDERSDRRKLDISFGTVSAFGSVTSTQTAFVDASVSDPGGLLRAFGIDNPMRDGGVSLRIQAERQRLRATVDAGLIQLDERGTLTANAELDLESFGDWRVPELVVTLPGTYISARDLRFDDPRRPGGQLADATGSLIVSIEDSQTIEAIAPQAMVDWLPARGWFAGALQSRTLILEDGRFTWRDGGRATIESGSLPLDRGASEGRLAARLDLEEPRTFVVTPDQTLEFSGQANIELRGSFTAPTISATLNLGPGSLGSTAWSTLRGTLDVSPERRATFDVDAAGLTDSRVTMLQPVAAHASGTAEIETNQFSIEVELREREVEGRPSIRIEGPVSFADQRIQITDLRVTGPLDGIATGAIDFSAATIAVTTEGLRTDFDHLGSWTGIELPAGHASGRIALHGSLRSPDVETTLHIESTNLPDYLELDPNFATWPTNPFVFDIECRRAGEDLTIASLRATIQDHLVCEASGSIPLGIVDYRLVVRAHEQPFTLRIEGDLQGHAKSQIESLDFRTAMSWNADHLQVSELHARSSVSGAPEQTLSGHATFTDLAKAIATDDFGIVTAVGELRGDPFDLAILQPVLGLHLIEGTAHLKATLGGTMPFVADATLDVRKGRVKLNGPVPTIENIDLGIRVDASGARFDRATADLGGGQISIEGGLQFDGWQQFSTARVDATVRAADMLLLRRTGLKLRTDGTFQITGSVDEQVLVSGEAKLISGRFNRRISVFPNYRTKGTSATNTIMLPSMPDPWGSRIRFDIDVESSRAFEVETQVVDTAVVVDARLRGTAATPRIEGTISADGGIVRLPAMSLTLSQALLTFDASRGGRPTLFAIARGKRYGVDVQAQVEGPLEELEVNLTSTPALSREDLTVLLSTGRLPEDLRERGIQSQAALVGTYLAQELLDLYFGSDATERKESLADRFVIEAGREVSRNGVETLTVEFNLRNGLFLHAERDMYEDYNMGVMYRFKF